MSKFLLNNNIIKKELAYVDDLIQHTANSKIELVEFISKHIVNSGGKKIRATITILCAKALNYQSDKDVLLAAAVELIHTATLLHDDVIDLGVERRGKPTANQIWHNKATILAGDYLFSKAFELMVKSNSLEALNILAKSSAIIAEGEVQQLAKSCEFELSVSNYFEIIEAKTAALFMAAAEIGAIISDQFEYQNILRNFGKYTGIIFQIIDDKIDYFSSNKVSGKQAGTDFFEGKLTLPILLLKDKIDQSKKDILKNLFSKTNKTKDDLLYIIQLLKEYNINSHLDQLIDNYFNKAINCINQLPENKYSSHLLNILEFAKKRNF